MVFKHLVSDSAKQRRSIYKYFKINKILILKYVSFTNTDIKSNYYLKIFVGMPYFKEYAKIKSNVITFKWDTRIVYTTIILSLRLKQVHYNIIYLTRALFIYFFNQFILRIIQNQFRAKKITENASFTFRAKNKEHG